MKAIHELHLQQNEHKGHKGHKGSDLERFFSLQQTRKCRWRLALRARRSAGLFLCVLCVLCVERTGVHAQAPDYSGTWKLNPDASQITKGTGITGLGAGGAPPTLYISQAANGTVVIGSDINESHARTFRVAKGALTNEAAGVRETLSLSADGQMLTVQVFVGSAAGSSGSEAASRLVYRKVQSDDPCEQWPTPCRYGTRSRF